MPRGDGKGPPWWKGKFRGCGHRFTIPRQAIIETLDKTSAHLSAEDIYLAVHKRYPNIGLTTVYRTLEVLAQMRLIFKFDFGDGRSRYELAHSDSKKEHHHHLVCTNCNRIIDYTDFINKEIELLNKTEKALSKKFNFKISNHLIQFYGLCEKCSKLTARQ